MYACIHIHVFTNSCMHGRVYACMAPFSRVPRLFNMAIQTMARHMIKENHKRPRNLIRISGSLTVHQPSKLDTHKHARTQARAHARTLIKQLKSDVKSTFDGTKIRT